MVGTKYVRLYSPHLTPLLLPHSSGLHTNTSTLDIGAPLEELLAAAPGLRGACYADVALGPGELLYLPPRWWHYVKALSASFSVSFWWE